MEGHRGRLGERLPSATAVEVVCVLQRSGKERAGTWQLRTGSRGGPGRMTQEHHGRGDECQVFTSALVTSLLVLCSSAVCLF